MKISEWLRVVGLLDGLWPRNPMPENAIDASYAIMRDVGYEEAQKAIHEIATSGADFPPTAGQIVARVRGVGHALPRRSPEEALALLVEATLRVGSSIYAKDFHDRHQAAVNWLANEDPVLALYAARKGLCGPGSFGHEEIHDPEFGGAVRHRIAGEITDVYEAAEARVARGLPAVDPALLTVRATGASGGMSDLLERLRPAEQIGSGDEPDDGEPEPEDSSG